MSKIKKLIAKLKLVFENREAVIVMMTSIISTIFIITLVNIQLVNGSTYRALSETKMLRTETIPAARGEILDRNGVILATNELVDDLVIYKVDITSQQQNEIILRVIDILTSNGDEVYSSFPLNETSDNFNFENKAQELSWKEDLNFEEDATFEEIIDIYVYRYGLEDYERETAIKIINVRYEAGLMGYSLFNPVTIAKDISEKSVAEIEEKNLEIPGIKTKQTVKRVYPYGDLFAHSVGYVSNISRDEYNTLKEDGYKLNSIVGKTGIEESFEEYLKGEDGIKKTEVSSMGIISSETITTRPISGDSVTLTLDYRLQTVAEQALIDVINDVNADRIEEAGGSSEGVELSNSGAVVVMDTATGEILAMVSYPSFDPNLFVTGIDYLDWREITTNALNPLHNRVISGTYSPGSTFKMLMGVAALEEEVLTVEEEILDKGVYPLGHNPKCWIHDRYGIDHGYVNVSEAIQVSCNYFFYDVGVRLGIANIIEYATLFGLSDKTGIEISGEVEGKIAGETRDPDNWYVGQTLSASIGQEASSFTPIAMVNYIGALANGGTLNRVSLVKKVTDDENITLSLEDLNSHIEKETSVVYEERNLDIDEEYLDAITYGMSLVTSQGGSAYSAFKDLGVNVAGKTGTAEVYGKTSNGLFVGYAPYENPKIAVYAVVEQGGEGTYVANVVKPILEEYFEIENSDKLNEKNQNVMDGNIEF